MSNATDTYTAINLAPGIDLMVRVDLVDDPETRALVETLKLAVAARKAVQS